MTSTENLANYSVLVKSWLLEENLQPLTKPAKIYKHLSCVDKYSLHPSSRKVLFATDGNHYIKPQPIKRFVEPTPSVYIYQMVLNLKLREHCVEEGVKRF